MGRVVIVAFAPKPDKTARLAALVAQHAQILREERLITDRAAYFMRAANGTIVEVFEWRSAKAIEQAHGHPRVQALWGEFAACCDYVPLASLAESRQLFAEFESLHSVDM